MADTYDGMADTVSSPSRSVYAVTPNDAAPLAKLPKALYVGTGGNVALRCVDDTADVVFKNVPSGSIVRVRAQFVRAAGTTASDILAHC